MSIKARIRELHSKDDKQLETIFSSYSKLIVEAPAGYGKTKTMISKIAYVLATGQLIRPKRILALTFSVNAAYKIKKDVTEQLPIILDKSDIKVNEAVFVSNYHGFCRHLLKRYGYLIHENLKQLDSIIAIDGGKVEDLNELGANLSVEEIAKLNDFNTALAEVNHTYIKDEWRNYLAIVKTKLIANYLITYNAIIAFTLLLFEDYPKIKSFYQEYFPIILVDEFQDTNLLCWQLLIELINEKTKVVLIGDYLQRIYGFIGAIPDLMNFAQRRYNMRKVELSKNYRFKDNLHMLQLDRNIRLNAESPTNPAINCDANIPFELLENQNIEGEWVSKKIKELQISDPKSNIAVLVKQRGRNINKIMEILDSHKIQYFYGLFSDEDPVYIKFHRDCSAQFSIIKNSSKNSLKRLFKNIEDTYSNDYNPVVKSLLELLSVFLNRVMIEYASLAEEDKNFIIKDTFDSRALKQNIEHIDAKIIVSTVHGAKGLEWQYVIIPDMEQFSFPSWMSLCGKCQGKRDCNLVMDGMEREFLDELSIFYVGLTRARKQVYLSASKRRITYDGRDGLANISCFLNLPGIKLNAF